MSLVNQYNTSYKDNEKKIDKKVKSLLFQVMQVNKITGFNLKAETMKVIEWIEANKEALAINNANKKLNNE
jgi:hypothetical protein